MDVTRVVAVQYPGSPLGRGSGYVVAPRLVLTSAHVVPELDGGVQVLAAAGPVAYSGVVVWRGTPGGRDDAALVEVDDSRWALQEGRVRWGRVVTNRPGAACETWGFPAWAQQEGRAAETLQPSGTLNPGDRYVADRYVMAIASYPPASANKVSPWGGLSGAALFCGGLLTGVVTADVAGGQHGYLDAVPMYVLERAPGFVQVLARYAQTDMVLEAVELRPLAASEPPAGSSPAGLLRASQQVVTFRGRQRLVDELLAWVKDGRAPMVWLLHGPGGQGKTRIAIELCHRMARQRLAGQHWVLLWLSRDEAADHLDVLADVAAPLLLVIDYAQDRPRRVAAALRVCGAHAGSTPVRVLLLSRTSGDWWKNLRGAEPGLEVLLEDVRIVRLGELDPQPAGRVQAYRQAVSDLARSLAHLPGYEHHGWAHIAEGLGTRFVDPGRPVTALTVQMTALADLLDAVNPSGVLSLERAVVEERLLQHERRYWDAGATASGLLPALSQDTLQDTLAAAMLLGADSPQDAENLLLRLSVLEGQTRDRRNTIREWIRGLYPPANGRVWGNLQPDRLAEWFVGTRLIKAPDMVHPLLSAAAPGQIKQLLTVYARAAHHPAFGGRLDKRLTQLCVRHPHVLAVPAMDIATQIEAPAPLIRAVSQLTNDPDTSLDLLTSLADHLPRASQRLAGWAVELSQRLTGEYRRLATSDLARQPDLAGSLNNLSGRLAALGRRGEALVAVSEAVEVYRELARARPDAFRPDLAMSLNNLSSRLAALGRHGEALAAIREAVDIRRELAADRPDAFLPVLAKSLNSLSLCFAALGRHGEALAAIHEAVDIRRELAARLPRVNQDELKESQDLLHRLERGENLARLVVSRSP